MYIFVQAFLDMGNPIDWAEIIIEQLHESPSQSTLASNFHMSSYLFYSLAIFRVWDGLPHEECRSDMTIYEYHPLLQKIRNPTGFKRVQDTFLSNLIFELKGKSNLWMSEEAMEFIKIDGNFYIQFPTFSYLRIGGFNNEPLKLPRYFLDKYVLLEVGRHLLMVEMKYRVKRGIGTFFPLELGHYRFRLMHDFSFLTDELKEMNLQPYQSRSYYDRKGFVDNNFQVDAMFLHQPELEYFWDDCIDEIEVTKRLHSRFSLG